MGDAERPILITGASGKLASVLRVVWPARLVGRAALVWQSRGALPGGLAWDPQRGRYAGPSLEGGVVLHLAGGRIGAAATLALTRDILDLARSQGALHVFLASSSAVYGPGGEAALTEDAPLRPTGDYALAKVAMEDMALGRAAHGGPAVTCLRIGNVLGCDALIGGADPGVPVVLDPVPGRPGGPVRSYIGPVGLAEALARLCLRAMEGAEMPRAINVAAAPPVSMAALLDAAGLPWRYGPANSDVLARVVLDVSRLAATVGADAAVATPATMVAEWRGLPGAAA